MESDGRLLIALCSHWDTHKGNHVLKSWCLIFAILEAWSTKGERILVPVDGRAWFGLEAPCSSLQLRARTSVEASHRPVGQHNPNPPHWSQKELICFLSKKYSSPTLSLTSTWGLPHCHSNEKHVKKIWVDPLILASLAQGLFKRRGRRGGKRREYWQWGGGLAVCQGFAKWAAKKMQDWPSCPPV